MNGKIVNRIIMGLLAMAVGLVLALQLSVAAEPLATLKDVKTLDEEKKQLEVVKEDLLKELNALEKQVSEIEGQKSQEDFFLKRTVSDLEQYRMSSGVNDVQGPGVVVTVKAPPVIDEFHEDYSYLLYNNEMFLRMINELKLAGAEAVSFNGQRIVGTTEIGSGDGYLSVNGVNVSAPFTIKAIGNPEDMKNALLLRNATADVMVKEGLEVSVDIKDNIGIARYSGNIKFKFAVPVVPEE